MAPKTCFGSYAAIWHHKQNHVNTRNSHVLKCEQVLKVEILSPYIFPSLVAPSKYTIECKRKQKCKVLCIQEKY